jgi:hypothetical protein
MSLIDVVTTINAHAKCGCCGEDYHFSVTNTTNDILESEEEVCSCGNTITIQFNASVMIQEHQEPPEDKPDPNQINLFTNQPEG